MKNIDLNNLQLDQSQNFNNYLTSEKKVREKMTANKNIQLVEEFQVNH